MFDLTVYALVAAILVIVGMVACYALCWLLSSFVRYAVHAGAVHAGAPLFSA